MLKAFEIENFKAFGGPQIFKAAPITLIYGPNSGGKSSIIQALMLLKQSIVSPANQRVNNRYLVLKGPYVDLGQSKSILHRHKTDRPVSFGAKFEATNQSPASLFSGDLEFLIEASFQEASRKGGQVKLELTEVTYGASDFMRGKLFKTSLARVKKQPSDISEQSGDSYFIKAFQFKTWDDVWSLADFSANLPRVRAQEHRINVMEWLKNASPESFSQLSVIPRPNLMTGKVTFLPSFIRDKSHGEDRNASTDFGSRVLSQIARIFSETFEGASYLGPLRSRPRRVYLSLIHI